MRTARSSGASLVELLAGLGLGLAITIAAVTAIAVALRHLTRVALRAEVDDVASLAVEAFTLDVRRAGFDPRAVGIEALVEASGSRLGLQADLDADGVIDSSSEEVTTIVCDLLGGRLSRLLGGQSLPLANGVVACALAYADETGAALAVPPGGLDAAARRRVRRARLDVSLVTPGLGVPTTARAVAALRVLP